MIQFFKDFLNICAITCFPVDIKEEQRNEVYLNSLVQKKIKRFDFSYFMVSFGISYDYLDKEDKEEFRKLFISYENVKKFTLNYQKKYIEKCKKDLPKEINECFGDICFVIYCHIYGNPKIDIKIFIRNIRDYFILDKEKEVFDIYRNNILFDTIRSNMIKIYPKLKKNYGMNPTIEKLLSYLDGDNDYNYELLKNILNKDLNKEEEFIPIHEKKD